MRTYLVSPAGRNRGRSSASPALQQGLQRATETRGDLQPSNNHILQYWAGTPDQHRRTNCLYCNMRIGAARRELARQTGLRTTSPGYECVSRDVWSRRFQDSVLPVGAHFWYKAQDGLWWLGKISRHAPTPNTFIVRFLDDPGPVRIALSPSRYTTSQDAVRGSWCLQVHRSSSFLRGLQRDADKSRGAPTSSADGH